MFSKLAGSLCLLALTAAPAIAENFTVGIEAGLTASRVVPNDSAESITIGPGAIAGLYTVVPILKSVSFMSELVYVQKYSRRAGNTDATIEYVEVPLLAKMPFLWRTYFAEGVSLAFPVNVKGFPQNLSQTTSPDTAIVIGGGYDIQKLAIEFRYEGGLRRLSTVGTAPAQRTRSFMLIARLHI